MVRSRCSKTFYQFLGTGFPATSKVLWNVLEQVAAMTSRQFCAVLFTGGFLFPRNQRSVALATGGFRVLQLAGCFLTSRYGTIALCHFHEHFVHVADVGLERIKTRRVCWHGDSDYCTVLPLTCNRGTRPCQVSVRLRHLSVNDRSLK